MPEQSAVAVLIVEDEESIATVLAMIVEDAGYQPYVMVHGRQALAWAQQQRPALVITDLMMPHLNGHKLIAALHEIYGRQTPPIVLMSAAGAVALEGSHADAVLAKPFEVDMVEALLQQFLADSWMP